MISIPRSAIASTAAGLMELPGRTSLLLLGRDGGGDPADPFGQVGVADDEYYRTLSLVAVVNGQIIEVVHCCTGNWSEATRAGYYAEHGADAAPL